MISTCDFFSVSLNSEQSYRLIEYVAINLCGKDAQDWWFGVGCLIGEETPMLGQPIWAKLNAVWWNLVTMKNYKKEWGDGPLTSKKIDENKKKYPIDPRETEEIKKIIKKYSKSKKRII